MPLNIIVCHNNKRGIGLDNNIPWHSKEDLKYFKEITLNGIVIMGANTWNSISMKFPLGLPYRENIVLCSNHRYLKYTARRMDSLHKLDEYIYKNIEKNLFIIGGEMLYNHYINDCKVQKLFITVIDNDIECDKNFPNIPAEYILDTVKVSNDLKFCVYKKF
jgi:dihydrofolate reductase